MLRLALDELARGGHPVSPLPHYTVQAYNNTRFSKGGLAFQSAARDPLVREDGHFVFSGVVLSQGLGESAWSRPDYPQRCKRRVVVMYTAALVLA